MADELVINEQNFDQYFFDVRKHKPQKGQIMAGYTAVADLVDGPDKRFLIDMLGRENQAQAATRVMRKAFLAHEKDAIRIPLEIAKDLASGMLKEEVAKKTYKYTMEMFFYAKEEYVPKNDPHWFVVSLANLDKFLESENKVDSNISVKVVKPENS
jgi:hypothetical protein